MKPLLQFTVLFLCICYGTQAKQPQLNLGEDKIAYDITIDSKNVRIAKVRMSFIPKDSVLYMINGASQLPKRWATFVQDIKAVDSRGKSISLTPMDDAMWRLPSSIKERITVSYKVHLDHENHEWSGGLDGVAYATEWGVFYTARALLIFHGGDWEDIRIDFSIPESWKITTPWQKLNPDKHSFKAQNHSALMQAMLFAGTHDELSFRKEGFELIFALGGEEVLTEKQTYEDMATGILDYYIDLMGGVPNPSSNNVLDKAVVIINSAGTTDGEVIGNNISILVEKGGDQMSKMISKFIFAHEFFHLWNGKSFLPEGEDTEWFKEGFTNFYTLKALRHIGFLNDDAYFQVLNNLFYQRYSQDEGVGKLSMIQGEEKHAHWGLIYGGGLFVAIAQDIIIRKATANAKSLDHLMKAFFQKYGGTNERYTIEDIQHSLSELSSKDQTNFFKTHIAGTEPLPIADYLSMAGLHARIEEGNLRIAKKESASSFEKDMVKGILGLLE